MVYSILAAGNFNAPIALQSRICILGGRVRGSNDYRGKGKCRALVIVYTLYIRGNINIKKTVSKRDS